MALFKHRSKDVKTRCIFKNIIVEINRALLSLNEDSGIVNGSKMT